MVPSWPGEDPKMRRVCEGCRVEGLFDIYGYRFRLTGDAPEALRGLAADFGFFRRPAGEDGSGAATIRTTAATPAYDALPPLRARIYTPRNISYRDGHTTLVDYHGRGLARHDRRSGDFEIVSLDPDLLYEACYLFILSQAGEFLDRRGLHRVHALGVEIGGRAVLVLLPMGGGKSTLGEALLRRPEVRILSDDSPLIDRQGTVHAFPTRIGLLPGHDSGVPERHRRTVNRMNFGPKTFVDYDWFADRVVARAPAGLVCLGVRTLAAAGRIEKVSRTAALRRFLQDCVVGMGLFQGLEFVFQKRLTELSGLAPVAWSRLRASRAVIRRSACVELLLARDADANAALVVDQALSRSGSGSG